MIQALTDFGIDAKDIRTTNFSIWPMDKYDPLSGAPTGEKAYSVDNTVYVTIRDLDKLGDLLDTVVTAGANTVNSIQFDVADKDEALKQARADAVKNAAKQAQELADAAGVSLGEIQSIGFYDSAPYPVFDGKGGGWWRSCSGSGGCSDPTGTVDLHCDRQRDVRTQVVRPPLTKPEPASEQGAGSLLWL
jgi:hypothetical protein